MVGEQYESEESPLVIYLKKYILTDCPMFWDQSENINLINILFKKSPSLFFEGRNVVEDLFKFNIAIFIRRNKNYHETTLAYCKDLLKILSNY